MRSATQRLADRILGQTVEHWVDQRRAEGRAWPKVARDLYEATDGEIDVTGETLRRWAGETVPAAS